MSKLCFPKVMPEGIVTGIGDAGIKLYSFEIPALCLTYGLRQACGIIIRVNIAEGLFCREEKILSVYESDCAERSRNCRHCITPKIITPPKALRRVGRGASNFVCLPVYKYIRRHLPCQETISYRFLREATGIRATGLSSKPVLRFIQSKIVTDFPC